MSFATSTTLSSSPADESATLWNSSTQQASLLDELNATSGAIESGIHSIDFFPLIVTVSPDVYSSIEFDPDNPDPSFDRNNPKANTIFSKSRIPESDDVNVNGTRDDHIEPSILTEHDW